MGNIEEYFLGAKTSKGKSKITNGDLHELIVRMRNEQQAHLREQDYLLEILRNQSKPNFPREVGANIVGSALWDGFLCLGSKLFK